MRFACLLLLAAGAQALTRYTEREIFPRFRSARKDEPAGGEGVKPAGKNGVGGGATVVVGDSGSLSVPIKKARNSVVQILTTSAQFDWERPWASRMDAQSAGSGFLVELNGTGFIVTNGHVVEQAVGIAITVPAFGQELFSASIFGLCHDKDIAVLALEKKSKENLVRLLKTAGSDLQPLSLGDSDAFAQGSMALAVGYPLGHPNMKASTGVVAGGEHVDGRFYLQVTSPINPGNSGGPLLDARGSVMGINTAAIEDASNVGYAIPAAHFKGLLHHFLVDAPALVQQEGDGELWAEKIASVANSDFDGVRLMGRRRGNVTKSVLKRFPKLGVDIFPATHSTAQYLGYEGEGGVYVGKVYPFGLLHEMGVKQGDLLLEFGGHTLDRFGDSPVGPEDRLNIYDLAERVAFGTDITAKVWRERAAQTLVVPMAYNQKLQLKAIRNIDEPMRERVDYDVFGGLVLMDLTLNHIGALQDHNPELRQYYDEQRLLQPRLVISSVLSESHMVPENSVYPGDVVTSVNGKTVNTVKEFREAFAPEPSSAFWTLQTDTGSLVVLDFPAALAAEQDLAGLNGYRVTTMVKNALLAQHKAEEQQEVASKKLGNHDKEDIAGMAKKRVKQAAKEVEEKGDTGDAGQAKDAKKADVDAKTESKFTAASAATVSPKDAERGAVDEAETGAVASKTEPVAAEEEKQEKQEKQKEEKQEKQEEKKTPADPAAAKAAELAAAQRQGLVDAKLASGSVEAPKARFQQRLRMRKPEVLSP